MHKTWYRPTLTLRFLHPNKKMKFEKREATEAVAIRYSQRT